MGKLFSIIWKNLRLLLRSRVSALIVLFGPLLIILVVGLAFNSSGMVKINLGYYSPEYTDLTNSFISVLEEGNYSLQKYDRLEDCKAALGSGSIHLCVVFPSDFRIDNTKVNQIDFFVDNSKINFFESVVDSIESDFNRKAQELTTGMTQELLSKLNQTSTELFNKSSEIEALKAEAIATKSDIRTIESRLDDIDVSFDYQNLGMSDVVRSGQDASRILNTLNSIAEDAVEEAETLVEDVTDYTDSYNSTSSEYLDLVEALNESAEEIEEINSRLNESKDEIEESMDISDRISDLSDNLRKVDTRLDDAAKAKSDISGKVGELKTRIELTIAKINLVEQTFDAITSNIQETEVTNLQTIVNPIVKNVQPVVTDESQLNFYFPYLIMLIIMFIGILLASTITILEKTSRAYFRNFVTPTSDLSFIFGMYLTTMIILVVQIVILLSIFGLYFKQDLLTNLPSTALILFLATSLFTFLGMFIGNFMSTEETGTLTSVSIASVLLFISDLIFPLERMPEYISSIAQLYNPFVVSSELLRKSMVHHVALIDLQQQVFIELLFVLILMLLAIISYKYVKRHFMLRYAGYLVRRELRNKIKNQNTIKLLEHMNNLRADQHFVTKDGRKIADLKQLEQFVSSLKREEFSEYVDSHKNLFADWISNSLKNEALAMQLYNVMIRRRFLHILSKAVKEFEKAEKEHKKNKPAEKPAEKKEPKRKPKT